MRPRDEGGFTLLEILVAMAVFALSSTALVASISGEINGTARIDEMFAASVVADNELAEFTMKGLWPSESWTSGEETFMGRTWYWRYHAVKTGDPKLGAGDTEVHADKDYKASIAGLRTDVSR